MAVTAAQLNRCDVVIFDDDGVVIVTAAYAQSVANVEQAREDLGAERLDELGAGVLGLGQFCVQHIDWDFQKFWMFRKL